MGRMSDGRMAVAGRTWQPDLADSEKEDKSIKYSGSLDSNDAGTRFILRGPKIFEFRFLIIGSLMTFKAWRNTWQNNLVERSRLVSTSGGVYTF